LAVVPRGGPDLEEDVVARRVRIGVRAVEMNVPGAGAVQAVGKLVFEALRVALPRGADGAFVACPGIFSPVDRIAEMAGVDLVEKSQLDEVADPCPERRARHRIRIFAGD